MKNILFLLLAVLMLNCSSYKKAQKDLFGPDFTMPKFENPELNQWAKKLIISAYRVKKSINSGVKDLATATLLFQQVASQLQDFKNDTEDWDEANDFLKSTTQYLQNNK